MISQVHDFFVMHLSPLDIQNKDFSTKMRGYNQDDVDDFLDQVTRDYEDISDSLLALDFTLSAVSCATIIDWFNASFNSLKYCNQLLLHKIPLIK
jgi:DivIVA domain-containing protein